MPVNLLRTAVGSRSVEHLKQIQKHRGFSYDGEPATWAMTRRRPTRADEIIDRQGSIYWIVQRSLCIRQPVIDLPVEEDVEGKTYCRIVLDPNLVLVEPVTRKHIQGWRYLETKDTPKDLAQIDTGKGDDLPDQMVVELRELGLM
ncbi:MAG: DUF1489 domain-containing protein [Alphaproteobacteria bacterium]|nr:DUF1489 domain-containing protein [Alphaproteobacteria bacterium SS10]